MELVSLKAASFDYGREPILCEVDVTVLSGVKYALVGVNGAGKTTLLAALNGELWLNAGARQVAGSPRIRMLHQETVLELDDEGNGLVFDCVSRTAFATELAIEAELSEINRALAGEVLPAGMTQKRLIRKQGHLQTEYERRGGYTMRPRTETALLGVGLSPALWNQPLERLSGGERRRAALAAILLSDADLLLLDEPTNHLDLESCEWLENFLRQYRGAAVLVSHDRQFLDRVAERTFHLEKGEVTLYNGNYSFFDRAYRQQLEQQRNAYLRQREKIRRTEDYIRRNIAGQKTKQAQSRRKRLAKEVQLQRPPPDPRSYRFRLQPLRRSGGMVLETEQLVKGYGSQQLFHELDLRISRGDRIGIIGPNGCGKTTLLKILSGREPPDSGRVQRGHNVDLGFYDQQLESVTDHHTVIGEMAAVDPSATLGELRGHLAAFGFSEEMVDRSVGRLSGGERGRLALLRLIKEGYNALLLDEPTNHLDVRSREALEEALANYEGTLVVVSHDRRFLNKIVNRLLVFHPPTEEGRVEQFQGNYADYRRHLEEISKLGGSLSLDSTQPVLRRGKNTFPGAVSSDAVSLTDTRSDSAVRSKSAADDRTTGKKALSKNEVLRRRQWIAAAEQEIAKIEIEKEKLLTHMSNPSLAAEERFELSNRFAELEQLISEKINLWEKWNLELEEGGGPTE